MDWDAIINPLNPIKLRKYALNANETRYGPKRARLDEVDVQADVPVLCVGPFFLKLNVANGLFKTECVIGLT